MRGTSNKRTMRYAIYDRLSEEYYTVKNPEECTNEADKQACITAQERECVIQQGSVTVEPYREKVTIEPSRCQPRTHLIKIGGRHAATILKNRETELEEYKEIIEQLTNK